MTKTADKGIKDKETKGSQEVDLIGIEYSEYERIYQAITKPLPVEAIEKTDKTKTRRGYDTTGFQYQYLVDRLNEAVGIGGWTMDWQIIKDISGSWGADKKPTWEVVVAVTVAITPDFHHDHSNHVEAKRRCVGSHKAEMYGDALKGAITNGFKKTVAFFGLGAQAYRGTIDDDYLPVPNDTEESTPPAIRVGDKVIDITYSPIRLGDGSPSGAHTYKITMSDGSHYVTTDRSVADMAKMAKNKDVALLVTYVVRNGECQILTANIPVA